MVTDIKTVTKLSKKYIKDVKNVMHIDEAYLYGSYAKGIQKKDSDVDICFFSKNFSKRRRIDVLAELFNLTRKYNKSVFIEPNAFPLSELKNDNPFVKEVIETGIRLI